MFKLTKKQKYKNKIIYHEDSYAQIELIPIQNKSFALSQIGQIEEFTDNHKKGLGYSEVMVRDIKPVELIDIKIGLSEINSIVSKFLKKHEDVYCAYGNNLVKSKTTVSYGFDTLHIMITHQDNLVKTIWINGYTKDQKKSTPFKETLVEICRSYDLMICDWEACEVIEVAHEEKLEEYVYSFLLNH